MLWLWLLTFNPPAPRRVAGKRRGKARMFEAMDGRARPLRVYVELRSNAPVADCRATQG